jgi:NADH-quinone oxidoreductase subunit E
MALSVETRALILRLRDCYPVRRSATLPALYLMQAEYGYCSHEGIVEVAELLDMVPADVFSVASYYTMFYKAPVGRRIVDVCTNLACLVRGSDDMLAYIGERLQTPVGGTSPDGRCTLNHVECVGYCERAPVMQIDYRPVGPLTRDLIDQVLAEEHLLPGSGPVPNGVAEASRDLANIMSLSRVPGSSKPGASG